MQSEASVFLRFDFGLWLSLLVLWMLVLAVLILLHRRVLLAMTKIRRKDPQRWKVLPFIAGISIPVVVGFLVMMAFFATEDLLRLMVIKGFNGREFAEKTVYVVFFGMWIYTWWLVRKDRSLKRQYAVSAPKNGLKLESKPKKKPVFQAEGGSEEVRIALNKQEIPAVVPEVFAKTYAYRRSVLEKKRLYELEQDGMGIYEGDQKVSFIPYKEVQRIRLSYKPGRYNPSNYACEIDHLSGSCRLFSTSFEEIGTFKDQGLDYAHFIKSLLYHAQNENPEVRFYSGHSALRYGVYWAIILLTVLPVSYTLFLIPVASGIFFLVLRIIFILYLLYYSLKMMKVNYPRAFKWPHLPAEVVPIN